MHRPFEVHVLAVSTDENLEFEIIVGQSARFAMTGAALAWRGYSGIVRRIEQVRDKPEGRRLTSSRWCRSSGLVPAANSRIFQHMSAKEIVTRCSRREDQPDAEWYLDRPSYPKHEYKLQYEETDLDFITRILEDAGISFYFWDDPATASQEPPPVRRYAGEERPPGGQSDPLHRQSERVEGGVEEYVTEVLLQGDVRPGKVTYRDHDFRRRPFPATRGREPERRGAPEDQYEQYFYGRARS